MAGKDRQDSSRNSLIGRLTRQAYREAGAAVPAFFMGGMRHMQSREPRQDVLFSWLFQAWRLLLLKN
jgi:hypothetical protein